MVKNVGVGVLARASLTRMFPSGSDLKGPLATSEESIGCLLWTTPRLKGVVANIAKPGHANMANREPALQRVVASAMQQVRDANGGHGCSRLQTSESRRIVHHVVRKKNFLSSAGLEVASRRIVHTTRHRNSGEEQQISTIPERVLRKCGRDRLGCRNRG